MRVRVTRATFLPTLRTWLLPASAGLFIGCGDDTTGTPTPPPSTSTVTSNPTTAVAPTPTAPSTVAPVAPPPASSTGVNPPPTTTAVTPPVTPGTSSSTPATETLPTTSGTDTVTMPDTSSGPTTEEPTGAEWVQSGNTWSITLGDSVFEVDASTGARIIGYSLGGTELMVPETAVDNDSGNENHYGSTFTLAPQADSGWPPPEHLDTDAFDASAAGAVLTMVGDEGDVGDSTIQLTKVFTADPTNNSIVVDYQVTNRGAASATWAPWQVTRVPRDGITFFPTGTGTCTGACPEELSIAEVAGYSFWEYNADDIGPSSPGGGNEWGDKWVGDGAKGWLGHVHDGVLLLLQFPDVAAADFPPDDGDIAIYASAQAPYVEIEPEGAYAPIAAQATLSWKVKWSLHEIPEATAATPGQALGDFADGIATQLGAP